jgi:hypothetical protein
MTNHPIRSKIFRRSLYALSALLLLGCALAARRSTTAPASQPLTTPPRVHRFADEALPIDNFRDADHDVDLTNLISFNPAHSDLYFGQCDLIGGDNQTLATVPLVVAMQKGAWVALCLADERLRNAEWQFVASGPEDGEIWGVLDDSLDNKGRVILLAHSTDTGQTWTLTSINKPFPDGQYDSFRMDKTGHGRLSIYVPGTDNDPARAGFYHFHTPDRGKTWSAAEHEPDALDPADDVPSDEEPPPLKSTPTRSAMATKRFSLR